jgi:hypothetical protein
MNGEQRRDNDAAAAKRVLKTVFKIVIVDGFVKIRVSAAILP